MPSNITDKLYLGDILLCGGAPVEQECIGKYAISDILTVNYQSLSYNQYAMGQIDTIATVTSPIIYNQYYAYTATTGTVP